MSIDTSKFKRIIWEPINWKTFPLGSFHSLLRKLDSKEIESDHRILVLMKFHISLWNVNFAYSYITSIIMRLNEALGKIFKESEIPHFLRVPIGLLNLDFISLIIFCSILMDRIAFFLSHLLKGEKKPKKRSYFKFKNDISKFDGDKSFRELTRIINKTTWFKNLHDLRNDYVVHHGQLFHQIGFKPSTIKNEWKTVPEFQLFSRIKDKRDAYYSIENINVLCENILCFLEKLNEFLCENIDLLPIKITKLK